MKISKLPIHCAALWLAGAAVGRGDEITLSGAAGQRLTGTVAAMHENGAVELVSPLSAKPLKLKSGAVSGILLREEPESVASSDMLLVLANGDQLPFEIESFRRKSGLSGSSPALGALTLPPETLRALEFGVSSRQVFFQGPGELTGWSGPENRKTLTGITAGSDGWQVAGSVVANRKIAFPRDFILRFRLKWKSDGQPNLRMFFCGEHTDDGRAADRYLLQFASAGFEIKRESEQGPRFPSILIAQRLPGSFPDRQVDVMVQVNRANGEVALYLNDELEARGVDPVAQRPRGEFLSLQFNGAPNARQQFSDLIVSDLDNMRMRHREENRGDKDLDALFSRDDQRWSGTLREIRRVGKETEIIFEHPQSNEPIEISSHDASTVLFREAEGGMVDSQASYRLQLAGEGSLSVRSCVLSNDRVLARHPILGELAFPKEVLLRIDRITNPETLPDEESE